jgi:pyruvate dehydrogenase E1 component alpha subunit
MAAVHKLPFVFVCENNGYAEFTAQDRHMLLTDVADRAASYGMPSEVCDGMDAVAVRLACQRAVDRARAGDGPTLVEAKTYRYYDHQGVKGLRRPYRTEEEVEAWKKRDAIELLEARAAADGVADPEAFARIWEETRADSADAIAFAQASPEPDPSTVIRNVYSD